MANRIKITKDCKVFVGAKLPNDVCIIGFKHITKSGDPLTDEFKTKKTISHFYDVISSTQYENLEEIMKAIVNIGFSILEFENVETAQSFVDSINGYLK